MEEGHGAWGLTPAERDIALFPIRGMSTAESARQRATSESTVRAQTDAICRKAGVMGRPRRLSVLINEPKRDDGALRPASVQSTL